MNKYLIIGAIVLAVLVGAGIYWRKKGMPKMLAMATADSVKVTKTDYETKQLQAALVLNGTDFNIALTAGQNGTISLNADYSYKATSSTNMSPNTPTPNSPTNETIVEFYKKDKLIYTLSVDWIIKSFVITPAKA